MYIYFRCYLLEKLIKKISYLSVTFAQHSQIHSAKQQQQINFGNTLICIMFFRLRSHAGSCGQPHFLTYLKDFFFFALRYGFDFEQQVYMYDLGFFLSLFFSHKKRVIIDESCFDLISFFSCFDLDYHSIFFNLQHSILRSNLYTTLDRSEVF